MKFFVRTSRAGLLLATFSLLACIGFAAYALQVAPPVHQPLEIAHRSR